MPGRLPFRREPTMPDHATFLQMIIAEPDADGPRLVYADWLEEHGDTARAEFIRVQCEAEHLPEYSPPRMALERRAAELEAEHGEAWTRPLANLVPAASQRHLAGTGGVLANTVGEVVNHFRFRRGFVEEVTLGATDLIDYGPELIRLAPLRDVTLHDVDDVDLDLLAALPCLTAVDTIRIPNSPLGDPDWLVLLYGFSQNQYLERLAVLDLGRSHVGGRSMHSLLRSQILKRVRRLNLERCGLDDKDVTALARNAAAPGITHLELSGNDLGDAAARAIADSPYLTNLTSLGFNIPSPPYGLSGAGVESLVTSPNLRGLTALNLNGHATVWEPDGLLMLARSPYHTRLTTLQLAGGRMGPDLIAELVAGPALARLKHLVLGGNDIVPAGLRAIVTAPCSQSLNYLDVSDNCCGENLRATLAGVALPHLYYLNLAGNHLGDAGARALAAADLPQLTHLDLSYCDIDDAGAHALAESPGFRHLHFLNLAENEISTTGADALTERFGDRVIL